MDTEINIMPTGGLSNYLRVLFSFFVKAKQENKQLNVIWLPTNACPDHYLNLFEPVTNVNFVKTVNRLDYRDCFPYEPCNTPMMYIGLKPLPKICDQIRTNIIKLGENYIALHIRRTDHIADAQKYGLFTSDEDFISFIEANPNKNIFIATDNRNTQDKFISLYGERIKCIQLITPHPSLRQTTLENAVVDIFTCAFADKFKGSGYSSFTDLINDLRFLRNNNLLVV